VAATTRLPITLAITAIATIGQRPRRALRIAFTVFHDYAPPAAASRLIQCAAED
jgi:hypothetical protein